MNAIEIGGDRYIKAADAADLTGYATDYIGQLSRSGKVSAERVGRVWYVREKDILEHKKGNGSRSNKRKTQESLKKEIADLGQIHHVYYDPSNSNLPEYRKRLLNEEVRYEKDTHPLAPELLKAEAQPEKETAPAPEVEEPVHHEIVDLRTREYDVERSVTETPLPIEDEKVEEISDASNETVFEPQISPRMDEEEASREEVPVLRRRKRSVAPNSAPISHIPLSQTQEIVPHGNPSYSLALPMVNIFAPIALLIALAFSVGGVFMERVMVYEQGKTSIFRPSYEESFGVRAVSAVEEGFSSEVKSLFSTFDR